MSVIFAFTVTFKLTFSQSFINKFKLTIRSSFILRWIILIFFSLCILVLISYHILKYFKWSLKLGIFLITPYIFIIIVKLFKNIKNIITE